VKEIRGASMTKANAARVSDFLMIFFSFVIKNHQLFGGRRFETIFRNCAAYFGLRLIRRPPALTGGLFNVGLDI
jgi:hypothetical protein